MKKPLYNCRIIVLTMTDATNYAAELLCHQGAYVKKIPLSHLKTNNQQAQLLHEILNNSKWDLLLIDCFEQVKLVYKNIPTIYVDYQSFQCGDEAELQSSYGWMALTGNESEAIKIGGSPASILVGCHIAFLSICQLLENGQPFTINIENILLSALKGKIENVTCTNSSTVNIQKRNDLVPMTIVPAIDGQIFIGAPSDEQWDFLMQWAEITIPNTSTNVERLKLRATIHHQLADWTSTQHKIELMDLAQSFRLPFASVQTHAEIIKCPQHQHREFIKDNQMSRSPWKGSVGLAASRPFSFTTFEKLQILDLTAMWAGPYCSRLFADLGANVIKIEASYRPDGIRSKAGISPFFTELNRNKYSITCDLRNQEEKEFFLNLVKESHIVVNNFSPRVMENFQLTPEDLENYNDGLIYASLSAFGQTGPYRNYIGYGSTLEAMGGIVAKTKKRNNEPILPGFSISDITAGVIAAFAIALSIYEQQFFTTMRTIDVSQYEVATMIAWENSCTKGQKLNTKSLEEIISQKPSCFLKTQNWWKQSHRDFQRLSAPTLGEHNHIFKADALK